MHEKKLHEVKKGKLMLSDELKVKDMKISDYSVDVKVEPAMNYQDALLLAMKKEKASYRLYTTLAHVALDPKVKEILKELAMEESNHKLRFEIEYDAHVLLEN
jgi:rubrerythrin